MQIRPATQSDYAAIWAILEPVFRAGTTYAVARDISRAEALAMWCEAPRACFVAEEGGAVLGTFYIKTNHPGGGAHVCNCGFVTAGAAQGKGVARAMCDHAQREAVALGYKAMQFNLVLASNPGAIALWRKLGFAEVGHLPRVFDHPEEGFVDALVMYKWLASEP